MSTPIRKAAHIITAIVAMATTAHSRPGETSGKIQQRFGQPLQEREPVTKDSDAGTIVSRVARPTGARGPIIGDAKTHEAPRMRYVGKPHFTPSMRETTFVYKFGEMGIVVHFFDDRSQREEYSAELHTRGFKPEDIGNILNAASNGAEWIAEFSGKDNAEERVYEGGKIHSGYYKSAGLTAWLSRSGKVIVETDAFRELRLAEESKKPQPGIGQPIPGKGKGL